MYWNASPFRSQAVLFNILVVVNLVAAFVPSVVASKTDEADSEISNSDNSHGGKDSMDAVTNNADDLPVDGKKKNGIFKKSWKGVKNNPIKILVGGSALVGLSYWLYNKYYASASTPKVPIGIPQKMPGLSGGVLGGQAGKPIEKPKSQSSNATLWWIVAGVVVIALLLGVFIVFNVSGDNQEQMQDRDDEMERGERRRHHRRAGRGGHRKRHKKQRRAHR